MVWSRLNVANCKPYGAGSFTQTVYGSTHLESA